MFKQPEKSNPAGSINLVLGLFEGDNQKLKENVSVRYNDMFKPCDSFTAHGRLFLDPLKDFSWMLLYIVNSLVTPLFYLAVSIVTFNLPQILITPELFKLSVTADLLQAICLIQSVLLLVTRTAASIGCGYTPTEKLSQDDDILDELNKCSKGS